MATYRGRVTSRGAGMAQSDQFDGPLQNVGIVVEFDDDQGPPIMPPIGSTVTIEVSDSAESLVEELVRWATSHHSYGKTHADATGALRRMTNAEFLADGYGDTTLNWIIARAMLLTQNRREDGHG